METLKPFFANLQSKPLYLNHSRSKSIQVCLDSASLPNLKPVYKLNAHDHDCSLTFSKETMTEISKLSSSIKTGLKSMTEKTFLLNNEIKVFSEMMHDGCAVSFLSIRGPRINMMIKTFSKMMESSEKLSLMHQRLGYKVNENAKNLKQLMDTVLAKYTQSNENNDEFKSFLQQLNQCAHSLSGPVSSTAQNVANQVIIVSDTSNDENEDDDEDEYDDGGNYWNYPHGRRRRYDDEDDEDDEDDYNDEDDLAYF